MSISENGENGPETWDEVKERLNKESDCIHGGIECEVVTACSQGCRCKDCLLVVAKADETS